MVIFYSVTISLFVFLMLMSSSVVAEDIPVDKDNLKDIESLINDADAGEDVLVFEPGTYKVNIELNKNIDLRARDTTNTVLESLNGIDPVISINGANNVAIQNFTFSNNKSAIKIFESNFGVSIDIKNNVFQKNDIAIEVGDVSKINIENNTFFSNAQGIDGSLSEADIRVYQNIFHSNENTFLNATNFDISFNCFHFNESVGNIAEVNSNLSDTIIFADDEEDDFHLTEESGCRDKGEASNDYDDTLSDLGAYGGANSDLVPNVVVINPIPETDIVDGSIAVSWNENQDYRVEGYNVYYSTSELKGLHDYSERENLSFDDAEDNTEYTVIGLDFNPVTPNAPAQLIVEPRDEKLIVKWNQSTDATSYTLYYQEQGGGENSKVLDGEDTSYTITGLSNDITYDVWVIAHYQKQYHFQVAAYLASSTESDFRESSFVLDDTMVNVGEIGNSAKSDIVAGRPEKIVAYPDLPDEGCFIATAAFGYYSAHEVQILRDFRDQYLLTSKFGTSFVRWYYEHGSKAASVINKYEYLKPFVRVALYPLIISVELINISFLLFLLILLALIAGAVLALRSIANRNKVTLQ